MRILVVITVLCFFISSALAQQDAGDKDAVDLSARMDTLAEGRDNGFVALGIPVNIGLQNPDNWEDFEVLYVGDTVRPRMRFGGPLIFDTTNNPEFYGGFPEYSGDMNGDAIKDIITVDLHEWFKGKGVYPYFDSQSASRFPSGIYGIIDYNEDGFQDVIGGGGTYLTTYLGKADFGNMKWTYPSDSTGLPINAQALTFGKFNLQFKPMIVYGRGKAIYLIRNTTTFAADKGILISDTVTNSITITNLYATDITGDGVTDLIVSDGLHLYIFKGGDDFGTYSLSTKTAFYTIKSPRLTDFGHYGFLQSDFGTAVLRAVGDITGSGIPYLAVSSYINESGYTKSFLFFYAGGKALDTLYDAVIGIENSGLGLDTLHSIDSTGKTICVINDHFDNNYQLLDLYFLMSRDCEKIPHKTNPQMATVIDGKEKSPLFLFASIGGGFVNLIMRGESSGEHTVSIYNMLGAEIAKRRVGYIMGKQVEQFSTKEFADGTYIAVLQGVDGTVSVKFPVSRTMNEQAPESPIIWEMHETIPVVNGLR